MQPSSHCLAAALCAVQGLQVLLCSGKIQPGFMRFAVLLVELRLFRDQFLTLSFQLFQAGQLGTILSFEIGSYCFIDCQLSLNVNGVFDDEGILSKTKGTLAQRD